MPNETDRDVRRKELADRIATIVLADGLDALALRGLAQKLSTSGRMLLYYFKTRDALVVLVLRRVAERLDEVLARRPRQERLTPGAFLAAALATSSDPAISPFVRVWTEVVARGARGETPFQHVASEVVVQWLDWIDAQLQPAETPPGRTRAAAILSIIEGSLLLEAARPGSTATSRAFLSELLDGEVGGGS